MPAAVLIKILHSVGSVLCPGQVQHLASANMWPSQSIPCLWLAGWKQTRHRPKPLLAPTIGPLVMSRGAAHFVQTMAWANTICHKLRCGLPSHVKTSYSRTSSHQQMRGWDPTTGWSVRNEHPNLSNHHLNAVLHLTNQHTHNMELCMVIVMSNMISWENARYISRLQSSPAFLLKARLFRHTFPNGATGEK